MGQSLKVFFVDFWEHHLQDDNYFFHLLKQRHDVTIDPIDPDVLFFSCYGNNHQAFRKHRCKKVFFSGENWRKSPSCDIHLSFSSLPTKGSNVYLPLWVLFIDWFEVGHRRERDISYLLSTKEMLTPKWTCDHLRRNKPVFCSFVVQNPDCQRRTSFCKKMMRRAKVVCPGNVLNNAPLIGGRGDQIEKIQFLKTCRFNIAFENSRSSGYVTEKIAHALYAGCIPIYWGGALVKKYFNPNKFIYCNHPWTDGSAIRRALELDSDLERMVNLLNEPSLTPTALSEFSPHRILGHFYNHKLL